MSKCASCGQAINTGILKCSYCRKAFCDACWQKGVKLVTSKKKSVGFACEVCKALMR
jgi:hypothetical protein